MKLGTNLEGCVLVYNGRALYHDVSKYNIGKFKLYHDRVTKDYTGYNVWYDTVERVCFSGAQFVDIRNAGKDQNFYSVGTGPLLASIGDFGWDRRLSFRCFVL